MSTSWWRPGAEQSPQQVRQPTTLQDFVQPEAVDSSKRVVLHGFQDKSDGDPKRYNRGEFGTVLPAAHGLGAEENTPAWDWITNQKPVEVFSMGEGEDAFIEKLGVFDKPAEALMVSPSAVGSRPAPPAAAAAPVAAPAAPSAPAAALVRVEFEYEDGETVEANYHGLDVQKRSICLYTDGRDERTTRYSPRVGQRVLMRASTPSAQGPLELYVKHLGVRHEVGHYRCIILFPSSDD